MESKTAKQEKQRVENKIEIAKVDLNYKTNAYLAAYTLISNIKHLAETYDADPVARLHQVEVLIKDWESKDEALYVNWHSTSQRIKRSQRMKAASDRKMAMNER